MKITVVRSGGFAGISRTWQVSLVSAAELDAWDPLLRELPWNQRLPAPPAPDRFVYRIRVSRRRIILTEQQLDGPWRELVRRVQDAAD